MDLEHIATEILLYYFQSWGQTLQKRIDTLNLAVETAGIHAKFVQEGKKTGWEAEDVREAERAKEFRKRIHKCYPLGQWESEHAAILRLLEEYKENKIRGR